MDLDEFPWIGFMYDMFDYNPRNYFSQHISC